MTDSYIAYSQAANQGAPFGVLLALAIAFSMGLAGWWKFREPYIERLVGFTKSRKGAVRLFRFNFIAVIIMTSALWWGVFNR